MGNMDITLLAKLPLTNLKTNTEARFRHRLVEYFPSPVCSSALALPYANKTSTVAAVAATASSPCATRATRSIRLLI
jgi:hypothetical protein